MLRAGGDALDLSVPVRVPTPGRGLIPPAARETIVDRLVPRADGGYDYREPTFTARIQPDGSVTFEDAALARAPRPTYIELPVDERQPWMRDANPGVLGVELDLDFTEIAMRAVREEPYGHAKQQFMLETRALRHALADEAHEERLRASILALPQTLDALWTEEDLPTALRRRRLFELWDEAIERGDPKTLRAARMARRMIEVFVRERLPEGSPDAFSRVELARLNASRTSSAAFDPYSTETVEPDPRPAPRQDRAP